MAERIEDACSAIAYQALPGGIVLAFKVRHLSVEHAARAGVLARQLNGFIGASRTPDDEDLTGLEAAQIEAAQQSRADQEKAAEEWVRGAAEVARISIIGVQDLDDPSLWRKVLWVGTPEEQGDFDGMTALHMGTVLRQSGLQNVFLAATLPAMEVAGHWGPFRR
jgi:hypothetical protein